MISAFARGYRVSEDKSYLEATEKCIAFIEKNLVSDGHLLRTCKDGQAKLRGYLEDYSYFINALLDVFEANPKSHYLELATSLANYLVDHFWDDQNNSFYFTADDHEKLIIRPKNNYDLSMPSGNSVAANSLLRLYHLTQEKRFLDISLKTMESFSIMAAENPFGFGYLLNAIYLYLQSPTEITVLNTKNKTLLSMLTKRFLPEAILVTISGSDQLKSLAKYPFFAGKEFNPEKTTVFACKNFACSLPLESESEIEKLL
jgi:hypothetical protein